jgi:hypothetical protein
LLPTPDPTVPDASVIFPALPTVALLVTDNVPALRFKVPLVTVTLLTAALPARFTCTPGLLITTSSPLPGTTPVLQSAAVFHDPLPLETQLTMLNSLRLSSIWH